MERIGLPQLLVVLAIALLVFGPRRLPDLVRRRGQAIRGFKEAVEEGQSENASSKTNKTSQEFDAWDGTRCESS